jgi:hypothetical protein
VSSIADALAIDQFVVMGHSGGGALLPGRVLGVVRPTVHVHLVDRLIAGSRGG